MNTTYNPDAYFKCVKVPLKPNIKHPEINLPKISNTVMKAHKIVIHTLQFMKLYLLDYYNTNRSLPTIDKTFINSCMKILCKEKPQGRPPKPEIKELKDKLSTFYEKHYKSLMKDTDLEYTHMNTILDYLTIDVLTMYENNIKQRYIECVERYVNVVWRKKYITKAIRKVKKTKRERDSSVYSLKSQLRKIKNDILNVESNKYESHTRYHPWITEQKKYIIPTKTFKKNSLYYDLQCSPYDYLPCMITMMKIVENDEFSINNVFPLRSDIIPKHIRIDTTSLVHLLFTDKQGTKGSYLTKGNLKRNEDKIWQFFFSN